MRAPRVRLLVASVCVFTPMLLAAAFPARAGYVTDLASVLDEAAERYLEDFLGTLERDTAAEVVVVTVSSLEGRTIEDYANALFAAWGIGQAAADNGVLLLVAPADRRVRIEVGYGLEPILPDGLAGEIIRTEILPEFRAGNTPRGIGRGLNRISQIIRGNPHAGLAAAPTDAANDLPPAWFIIPFFATFLAFGSFAAGLGLRTRTYGPLITGAMFAGVPLLLALTVTSGPWLGVLAAIGAAALALGYRRGISAYWMDMLRTDGRKPAGRDSHVDWIMGGTTGSSSDGSSGGGATDSGGSSSSGGDSGGGSSGGGGASGHW